jgi:hypothetical protein
LSRDAAGERIMFTYEKQAGRTSWVDLGQGSREQARAAPPPASPKLHLVADTGSRREARK